MTLLELYESITLDGIKDWVAEGKEETVHLDFKLVRNPSMSRDDRKNLAVALSGFANSEGGIIVWGVNARKNSDGIDCAQNIDPITNVSLFMAKLNEFSSEVSPSARGVRHKKYFVEEDAGIAITYIPESDSGPHMAKASVDRYMKRSGDSFLKMEHFEVADMFGRRKRPKLEPELFEHGRHWRDNGTLYRLRINNVGRASAVAPYVSVQFDAGVVGNYEYGIDGNGHKGLQVLKTADPLQKIYGGNTDLVIHPSAFVDVDALPILDSAIQRTKSGEDIIIKIMVASMDMQMAIKEFHLNQL